MQEFGNRAIAHEMAGDFQGLGEEKSARPQRPMQQFSSQRAAAEALYSRSVPQHEADLVHLEHAYLSATEDRAKAQAHSELQRERAARKAIDGRVRRAVDMLLRLHPGALGRDLGGNVRGSYKGALIVTRTLVCGS